MHTQVAKLEPEFLASPENDHAVFCSATAIMTNIDILLKLLEQNEAELKNLLPDADTGFYSAGLNQKTQDAQIVFAGIQSIANATI